jgi:GntR family transcriptional regulator
LARAAAVNPMTVSKAYSRLEAEGIVQRIRSQGMRISKTAINIPLKQRQRQFRQLAQLAIARGHQLGLTESQILDVLDSLVRASYQDSNGQDPTKEHSTS